MHDFIHFINSNSTEFIVGLSVLTLLLLVHSVVLSRRLSGLARRRGQKAGGETVGEITDCLNEHSRAIDELNVRTNQMNDRLNDHGAALQRCLSRVGLVRFNAFDDVGGEQSFALVMLDNNSNGIALSSIYGRQDSRLYAKVITNADAERPLSDEERKALHSALSDGNGSTRTH